MKVTCANCQTRLPDNAKFCFQCGQNTKNYRRPFLPFIKDAFHELLDIDGRLALTLKTLLFKPGVVTYEFEQGMRNKYTPPLRLYLVASLLFFLLLSSFQRVYTSDGTTGELNSDHYSKAMFVLFPLFALYIRCFFWNSYYLANLFFSMHLHTVGYLVLMIVGPLEAIEEKHPVFLYAQIAPVVYVGWYLAVAFKTMYRESWPATLLKVLGVYLVYLSTFGLMFDVVLA